MKKLFALFICLLAVTSTLNVMGQCNAVFSWQANPTSANQSNVEFVNNSTTPSGPNTYVVTNINFGDGSPLQSFGAGMLNHVYPAAGTYNVIVNTLAYDSTPSNATVICEDADTQLVTVASASNYIDGYTFGDTSYLDLDPAFPINMLSIRVWLIVHDAGANTLTAVDSMDLPYDFDGTYYRFNNKPAGLYLVKAALNGQTSGLSGWMPTYHLQSVYWSSATNIAHTGSVTTNKHIYFQNGMTTSGPGFIGGNISAGAGKGTGTGVAGMLVFIRNGSNQLITSAITNADGDFSFSNLPVGTYSVYPEAINYATTPYNTIHVTSGQANVSGIDFVKTSTEIKLKQTTGIAAVPEKDGLKIYPNPARNTVTIENQHNLFSHVKIMNAVGQLVSETSLKNGMNKVDISALNTGIYYLLISSDNVSRSMKFVKE